MEKFMTIREAAQYKNVTRQAVYLAVKEGRIRTFQIGKLLKVDPKDIEEYDRNRYSRMISVFEGEKIYDDAKGLISVDKAAKLLGMDKKRVYYVVRRGFLKAQRKRFAWVINLKDLNDFKNRYFKNDLTPKKIFYSKKVS